MTIIEMRQARADLVNKMEVILNQAKAEQRNRNEQEVTEWEQLEEEVRNLDVQIQEFETTEKRNIEKLTKINKNKLIENRMTIQNLIKENRNGVGFNPFTIDTRSIDLTSGVYNETVLDEIYNSGEAPLYMSMGIDIHQNLDSNLKLPKFSAPLLGGKVAPGTASQNDKTLSYVDLIDNDSFMLSETISLDMLKNDNFVSGVVKQLVKGVDRKITQTVFSVALANATAVTGVTAVTKANCYTLESLVDADKLAYLASKEAFATGRGLSIDTGSGIQLFSKKGNGFGETFEGTPLFYSAGISKQLVYGDLMSISYGDWGGYEVGYDISNKLNQATITVRKKAGIAFRGHSGSLVKTVIA